MIGGLLSGSSWLVISRKSNWAHKRSLFLRLKFFQISRVIQYKVEEIFVILQLALENASNREILILLNKFCLKVQWSCMKNINQLYFSKKKKRSSLLSWKYPCFFMWLFRPLVIWPQTVFQAPQFTLPLHSPDFKSSHSETLTHTQMHTHTWTHQS